MIDRRTWLRERLKTILLATDLEQNSRVAAEYAVEVSKRFGGDVIFMNAFQFGPHSQTVEALDHKPSRERHNAQEGLAEFIREMNVGDSIVDTQVVEGPVPSAILKAEYELDVDLLVVGTTGIHKGMEHLLLGSNTEALMLGSHRPTLTVGPLVPPLKGKALSCGEVIYVSDFGVASTAAAKFAFEIGKAFDADANVYQLASKSLRSDRAKLRNNVQRYCDILQFANPDLPAEWFDVTFQLSRIVDEEAFMLKLQEPGNLIVLGVQPASFIQRHLHSSFAYRLLANAASPVLTISTEMTVSRRLDATRN